MKNLVLWHGWGMASCWKDLSEELDGSCEVHIQPLPGYRETPMLEPYAPDAIVEKLVADLPSPVTLCGWSMGSMLAMHAALRYPEKIERLILIGSTPSFIIRDGWQPAMEPLLLKSFSTAIRFNVLEAFQRFITLFNHNDSHSKDIVRELMKEDLPPTDVLLAGLDLLRDTDLRLDAAKISQPTLLIHGAKDPLMPLAAAQWLANALPDARLEVLKNAAHAPFLSDTPRCAKLIADFLHD